MRRFNALQEYLEPAIVIAQKECEGVIIVFKERWREHIVSDERAKECDEQFIKEWVSCIGIKEERQKVW